MNSSTSAENAISQPGCVFFILLGGSPGDLSDATNAVLLLTVVVNSFIFPFTILLNILVIIVVLTKPRLKTKSNFQLACAAVTDVLVGLIAQPLYIATMIILLQGDTISSEYCWVQTITQALAQVFCRTSIIHLVLMNAERYLAIKHPYVHSTQVTGVRIVAASATAWIVSLLLQTPAFVDKRLFFFINNSLLLPYVTIIIFCQGTVYGETRRHEKLIAAQQVSAEAKEQFLKDKKAIKVTTAVVLAAVLNYIPMFSIRVVLLQFRQYISLNLGYAFFWFAFNSVLLNSFVNSVIYAVRIRTFRVAFIEVLFRKNSVQAEQIEMNVFRTGNELEVKQQEEQQQQGQEQQQQGQEQRSSGSNSGSNSGNNRAAAATGVAKGAAATGAATAAAATAATGVAATETEAMATTGAAATGAATGAATETTTAAATGEAATAATAAATTGEGAEAATTAAATAAAATGTEAMAATGAEATGAATSSSDRGSNRSSHGNNSSSSSNRSSSSNSSNNRSSSISSSSNRGRSRSSISSNNSSRNHRSSRSSNRRSISSSSNNSSRNHRSSRSSNRRSISSSSSSSSSNKSSRNHRSSRSSNRSSDNEIINNNTWKNGDSNDYNSRTKGRINSSTNISNSRRNKISSKTNKNKI